jgi:hypothetical protein
MMDLDMKQLVIEAYNNGQQAWFLISVEPRPPRFPQKSGDVTVMQGCVSALN